MAITYPLSLPSSPNFKTFSMIPNAAVARNISPYSFHQQVYEYGGQIWVAMVELPPMSRNTAEPWLSFLHKLNGVRGTFSMGDPDRATPRGIATGTPLVNGASQTGTDLVTDGWTASQTGILKDGDFIQVGNSLFRVEADVNSDGSGNATIPIWPFLGGLGRTSPSNNAAITVTSPKGLWRLVQDSVSINTDEAGNVFISFQAEEAL